MQGKKLQGQRHGGSERSRMGGYHGQADRKHEPAADSRGHQPEHPRNTGTPADAVHRRACVGHDRQVHLGYHGKIFHRKLDEFPVEIPPNLYWILEEFPVEIGLISTGNLAGN